MDREQTSDPTDCGAYEIRHELHHFGANDSIEMHSAYSHNGGYIGDPEFAEFMTGHDTYKTRYPIRWVPRFITSRIPEFGAPRVLNWLKWNAWFHVPRTARQPGISAFYRRTHESEVCSIGFSARDQKWYGWSHRAHCGFGIGDTVKPGSTCATASPGWALPVGFKARTLDDARRMAAAHAEAVA